MESRQRKRRNLFKYEHIYWH